MPIYPVATYKEVPNHSGPRTQRLGFVVHVQVGDGSCYAEFDIPANAASSHFWISQQGAVEQYVDTDLIAWAEEAGNGAYISCEFEGFTPEDMTAQQMSAGEALAAWCSLVDGFPLVAVDHGGTGVTSHCHYPSGQPDPAWGDHSCPGPIRLAQIPALIAGAIARLSTTTAKERPMPQLVTFNSMFHTFTVDSSGNVVHRWYNPAATPQPGWGSEIVTTGADPARSAAVTTSWSANVLHVVADLPSGGQVHAYQLAGNSGWSVETWVAA